MIRRLEVRYRDQARSDLDAIFWRIALSGSPQTAHRYVQRLETRCQRIGDAPRSGKARDDLMPGLRTTSFERSALICYMIIDNKVWITNVFTRGRDVDASFDKASNDGNE